MYNIVASASILMFALFKSLSGETEITLATFSFVVAIALIGAGLDTMESKKK